MKAIMTGAFMGLSVTAVGAAAVDYLSANNLLPACKAIVGSKGVLKSSNLQKAHDVGFCSATLSTLLSLGRAQMLDDQFGCMEVPPEVSLSPLHRGAPAYLSSKTTRCYITSSFTI
jgi:hypothetical protein